MGFDIYPPRFRNCARQGAESRLTFGDMLNPSALPKGYFDVVHEFGAAYLVPEWGALLKNYFSLLRDDGILLWELPQKWSIGHVSYLLSLAPKITDADTKLRRILRSFSPRKYAFESDAVVTKAFEESGYEYEILERVPIWYFYCRGLLCKIVDSAWKFGGDEVFEKCERLTKRIWPRHSGYYLVVRKKPSFRRMASCGDE